MAFCDGSVHVAVPLQHFQRVRVFLAPITNMGFAMPVSEAIQLRRHAAKSLSRLEDDITRQQATIASLAASGHVTEMRQRTLKQCSRSAGISRSCGIADRLTFNHKLPHCPRSKRGHPSSDCVMLIDDG